MSRLLKRTVLLVCLLVWVAFWAYATVALILAATRFLGEFS